MPAAFVTPEEEYKKNEDLRKEDVLALMEWNQKQPHLPVISELGIILFLQGCYCQMEPAKKAIETFYTIRTLSPEVRCLTKPSLIVPTLDTFLCTDLPKKTPEGYVLILMKCMDPDVQKFDHVKTVVLSYMMAELSGLQLGTSKGQVIIFDCTGFTLGHVSKVSISLSKKYLTNFQEGMPFRLKAVHMINMNSALKTLIDLVTTMLNQKLRDAIHCHSTMDTFYKIIPQELMPEEYGGQAGKVQELKEKARANLLDNEKYFEETGTTMTDESKRVEKSKYFDDLFIGSVDGSFRKLDID